jgi:hypothetical protein
MKKKKKEKEPVPEWSATYCIMSDKNVEMKQIFVIFII